MRSRKVNFTVSEFFSYSYAVIAYIIKSVHKLEITVIKLGENAISNFEDFIGKNL